tara:strand:+ start:175675 stop:176637 length:963 start_codon:yes stop_codon:yes gene_type:complete
MVARGRCGQTAAWFVLVFMFATILRSPAAESDSMEIEVYDCVVRFSQQVDLPAMESGRVAEVLVKPNDTVEQGTRIARLDDRTLVIRRRAALLRANNARNDAIDDVELRYAETALAEAEAELDTNRSIQNDVRGAIALTQLRRLRLAVDRGKLEVALAKKRRKQAEIEVQLREADLSVIDDQIENLAVDSPINGVVLDVAQSPGEWIDRGQPIATVARMDRLHVHALVDGRQIAPALCTGLPVSVHWVDASTGQSKSLRGKVLSVDPETLPGDRFRLHAEVLNRADERDATQWQLKPGTDVRMKVYASRRIASLNPARTQ